MSALTKQEIMKLVNRYIGGENGYLGDFSYKSHDEFYPEYCGLDISPSNFEGTTRSRFISILESSSPTDQAKILKGVLERFPLRPGPDTRTSSLREEIQGWIKRLELASPVPSGVPLFSSEVVQKAMAEAETLIRAHGATSGVDRVHTALHGYLLQHCKEAAIPFPTDPSSTQLFKLLREQHPKLSISGPRPQDMDQLLRGAANIFDALNPIRNKSSVAHPNEHLLDGPEAMLAINLARTLLHYLDAKFSAVGG